MRAVSVAHHPVLAGLAARRGVVGGSQGRDVAQLPDARLQDGGGGEGTDPTGQGHHALDLRALLRARVVTAHARAQRRGRPDVERVARRIDEVVDAGRGGQLRDEGRRAGAPRRAGLAERHQVLHVRRSRRGEQVDEPEEHLGRGARVPEGPVLRRGRSPEIRGYRRELVVAHERARQRQTGQSQRIGHARLRPGAPRRARRTPQETHVEGGVVRDEDGGALPVESRPLHETIEDGGYRVRVFDHRGRDARQRRNERGNGTRGAREGGKLIRDAPVAHRNRADLRDLRARAEPRRL